MSFGLLLKDELNGYYRSKVMLLLWVGLPVISIIVFYAQPSGTQTSLSIFTAIIVSAIGGTLSSVMLAVTVINEKERKVYDLFVIRPIRRWEIVLSKFAAVFICVVSAGAIAVLFGLAVDAVRLGTIPADLWSQLANSLMVTVGMIGITASTSLLIGIASPSVLVGVIVVLYGSNSLASLVILPLVLSNLAPLAALGIGAAMTAVMLGLACVYFERKQL